MSSFYFYFFLSVVSLCVFHIVKVTAEDNSNKILYDETLPTVPENNDDNNKKKKGDGFSLDDLSLNIEDLKKMIEENHMDEAAKLLESLKKNMPMEKKDIEEKVEGEKEGEKEGEREEETEDHMNLSDLHLPPELGNANSNFLNGMMDPNYVSEMLKFYTYLQEVLNSKTETSEKKMVRKFLRKSMQNIKDNETKSEKKTVEEIIKNTEGHNEMLLKFADVMKIDPESLKNEETRNALDRILVGILKFMEYTNESKVVDSLLDEIEVKEVDHEEGGKQKKFQVNIQNSKTHFEILQKASNFMGLNLSEEHLKELTTQNKWYEEYLNQLLNFDGQEDEL